MSKPCLDYCAELGVPKSRYRNEMKVGATTDSTLHRGEGSHRSFSLFPAVWFTSCLYIMLLLHLLISNLNHFVHLLNLWIGFHTSIKDTLSVSSYLIISRHLFAYRRLFRCPMRATWHMNRRQNCNVFKEFYSQLHVWQQAGFWTSSHSCPLQLHCHAASVWRSTATRDNSEKMSNTVRYFGSKSSVIACFLQGAWWPASYRRFPITQRSQAQSSKLVCLSTAASSINLTLSSTLHSLHVTQCAMSTTVT